MERWIHVDLKCMAPSVAALKQDIARWASEGATGIVLEWENTFPYPGLEAATRGYSRRQVADLVDACAAHGLKAIPLVQTLGHLEWLLSQPAFARLREFPDHPNQIRACDEEAQRLLNGMVQALLEAHPESPYIHLGADEARRLPDIDRPECSAKREGACAVFLRHLRPLFQQVLAAGKRPVIWADMPLRHPENLDDFPREVVFCDWLYSQTDTLPNIPADRRALFETYWRMDADDFPAHIYQFPYLPFLRDRGFDVIAAPATLYAGNALSGPHLPRARANQRGWLRAAARFGGLGALNTCWQVRGALREQSRTGHRAFLIQARDPARPPDDSEVAVACWRASVGTRAEAVAAALDALDPPRDEISVTRPIYFDPRTRMHRPRGYDTRWEALRRRLADLPADSPEVAAHRAVLDRAAATEKALAPLADTGDEAAAWLLGAREAALRAEAWLLAWEKAGGRVSAAPDPLAERIRRQADAVERFMCGRYLEADVRAVREDRYDSLLRLVERSGTAP